MQIGCGLTVKRIKGIGYLYFWWFEEVEGRSIQKFKSMGREDDPESSDRGSQMMLEYRIKSRRTLDALIRQV